MKQRKYLLNLFVTLFLYFSIAQAEEECGACLYFTSSDNISLKYMVNWYSPNIDTNFVNLTLTEFENSRPLPPLKLSPGSRTQSLGHMMGSSEPFNLIEIKVRNPNLNIEIKVGEKRIDNHIGKITFQDIYNADAICYIARSNEELNSLIAANSDKTFCQRYGTTIAGIAAGTLALLTAYYCGT